MHQLNSAHQTSIELLPKASENASLSEDCLHEILRQEVLENRRIQQINILRQIAHSNHYARM
jgi:hypothetical protein